METSKPCVSAPQSLLKEPVAGFLPARDADMGLFVLIK